ncbi:hypothetical protein IEQ34_007759 [Dendrobium chrysotoxum]|uniref:Uncharacterized protein n=1 Tax=Dendrobium chrysotoxum TaxID=161865 RepID=A0AAV7H4D8_DENCH|nr:hypothetical protein IEQ34_007759 [Dendrobium chrysotoxum]
MLDESISARKQTNLRTMHNLPCTAFVVTPSVRWTPEYVSPILVLNIQIAQSLSQEVMAGRQVKVLEQEQVQMLLLVLVLLLHQILLPHPLDPGEKEYEMKHRTNLPSYIRIYCMNGSEFGSYRIVRDESYSFLTIRTVRNRVRTGDFEYNMAHPDGPSELPLYFTDASFRALFGRDGDGNSSEDEPTPAPAPGPDQYFYQDMVQRFDRLDHRIDQMEAHLKLQDERYNEYRGWIRDQFESGVPICYRGRITYIDIQNRSPDTHDHIESKFTIPGHIYHWILQSLGVKWSNHKTNLKAEHWDR